MSLLTNIVSYWKLDESSGNAADSFGSNTLTNGSVTFSAGKINNGATFTTGLTSTTSPVSGTGDWSFNLWYKSSTTGTNKSLVTFGNSAQSANSIIYCYTTVGNAIQLDTAGASLITSSNTSSINGSYHMLTVTKSGNNFTMYIDGSSVGTTSYASLNLGSNLMNLGYEAVNSRFAWGSQLDETSFWSRAISGAEVTSLFNGGAGTQYPFSATTFTFTGPSSGNVNAASTNFTVTPDAAYTGTITITPTGTASSGLSPTVLTFTASATPQTFTITPTVVGSITLTPTNSGGLANPANLTYTVNGTVPSAPPAPVAVAGNSQATVTVSAPSNTGGSAITLYTIVSTPGGLQDTSAVPGPITVNGLVNGVSYTWVVKATNSTGDSAYSSASNSVTPTAPATPNTTFTNNGPKFNISRTVGNLISF